MIVEIILIAAFAVAFISLKITQRPRNFPPGPRGLPLVGNLLQLGKAPYLKFYGEWKEKYGPIIGVDFGSYRSVAISSADLVKEALQNTNFAGRPDMPAWRDRSQDIQPRGIIFTEGEEHSEMRRISIRCLKNFGYGQASFEDVVTSEVQSLLGNLSETAGTPVPLKNKFHVHILNMLWHIVAGKDCQDDREQLNKIYQESAQIVEENNFLSALFFFMPWVCKYFPSISGYKQTQSQLGNIWSFLRRHIDEHRKEQGEIPRDYIGAFISEMDGQNDPNSFFYKEVGDKSLLTSLLDLFFAGSDTVATTLHWACFFLAFNPEAQEKFYQEIVQELGTSKLPEAVDEEKMPYTQAMIQEILRFSAIVPLAVFHSALKDVNFHGYIIPKDTMVLVNLHSALHDKEYWGDPEKFRPERFLGEDGKSLMRHSGAFLPFGLGKRSCIGEALARTELFIFLTSIIQKFKIMPDPENLNPSMEPTVGVVLQAPNHKLVFETRKD